VIPIFDLSYKQSRMLESFSTLKRLGAGSFGSVYLVENDKKEKYALKQVYLKQETATPQECERNEQMADGEIMFLRSMNSPYIIKLY
jgi:serine/threonine protein kinase